MHIDSISNNETFKQFQHVSTSTYKPNFEKTCDVVDKPAINKKNCVKIAIGTFIGAVAPVLAINVLKKGRVSNLVSAFKNKQPAKNKFKAICKMFEIENYTQILATTTGGVVGGLLEGLKYSKSKEEKEAKYKEGIFEFLNNMTPTTLVALGTKYSEKTGKLKSVPAKAALIIGSVVGGMFVANKASNKINQQIFDKNKPEKETREFRPTDCLVHADDLLNLAVLTRIPLANKLQIDKLLPFIYARSGYEVAMAESKQSSDKK